MDAGVVSGLLQLATPESLLVEEVLRLKGIASKRPIARFERWLETLSLFDVPVIAVLSPIFGPASVIGPAVISPGSPDPRNLLWFSMEHINATKCKRPDTMPASIFQQPVKTPGEGSEHKRGLSALVLEPGDPTNRPPPARLLSRAVAFLIDVAIVATVNIVAGIRWGTETSPMHWQLNGLPACSMMIFTPAYWLMSESLFGATPGKFFLDLRLLSLRSGDVEFAQVLKRNLVKVADLPTLGLVSLMVAISNPLRQSLGDLWAGTMVVDTAVYAKWRVGSGTLDFDSWLKSFDPEKPRGPERDPQNTDAESPSPNNPLQQTRSAPLRLPLRPETLGASV